MGGFVLDAGISTTSFSLHEWNNSPDRSSYTTDIGSRFLSAEEKAAYCPDDVYVVAGLGFSYTTIDANLCSLSVKFSETDLSFGFQFGFLGFGGDSFRFLELSLLGMYTLLDYDMKINVCTTDRNDLFSERINKAISFLLFSFFGTTLNLYIILQHNPGISHD